MWIFFLKLFKQGVDDMEMYKMNVLNGQTGRCQSLSCPVLSGAEWF